MNERLMEFTRIPKHVGLIPDGNRRWAQARGLPKSEGYAPGVEAGFRLYDVFQDLGIEEVSLYGFTKENVNRPPQQVKAFRAACVEFGLQVAEAGAALLVVGDTESKVFPDALRPFTEKRSAGNLKVNLLVNYNWQWDLEAATTQKTNGVTRSKLTEAIASADVSRVELVVRWGGRRRLSGFLPIQCAYADFYVVNTLWPDMEAGDFFEALEWYQHQDVTLGG